MVDQPLGAAAAARPPGPGLLAAQRIVHAAHQAARAGHTHLSWANLRDWPAWAGPGQPPRPWQQALGACWHSAELQQCIDGARLNALGEAMGTPTLEAVLQLDAAASYAGAPLPAAGSAADWCDALAADGRTVALASLAEPGLRLAVAAALGWETGAPGAANAANAANAAGPPAAAARAWMQLVEGACA